MRRIRRPFPVGDVVLAVEIESELLESLVWSVVGLDGLRCTDSAELLQSSLGLVNLLDPVLGIAVSFLEGLFERGEPWVELDYAWRGQIHWQSLIDEAYQCRHLRLHWQLRCP